VSQKDENLLFRLHGSPVYAGDLAMYVEDVTPLGFASIQLVEHVGIVVDFEYDEEMQHHMVHFLIDGRIQKVPKSFVKLV